MWAPPVDVAEDDNRIHVKVEVPGMEEKDLEVHYEEAFFYFPFRRRNISIAVRYLRSLGDAVIARSR
jgi:HSP20 family molecular chaperone IbpA